jgi:hypothetical protein
MIQDMKFVGDLKFGPYKSISCNVHFKVETYENSFWTDFETVQNPNDFLDGVRATGEFYFDTSPITDPKFPVKNNAVGELTVRCGSITSTVNIIVVERTGLVDIIPSKIKRYFWYFLVVGKPKKDDLRIFPRNYS